MFKNINIVISCFKKIIIVLISIDFLLVSCIANNTGDMADDYSNFDEEQINPSNNLMVATNTVFSMNQSDSTTTMKTMQVNNQQNELSTIDPQNSPIQKNVIGKDDLLEFLHSKSNFDTSCELPCLWGIDPEIDSRVEINNFINNFGEFSEYGNYLVESTEYQNNESLFLIVWENDFEMHVQFDYVGEEQIKYLILQGDFPVSRSYWANESGSSFNYYFSQYYLPEILTHYGIPSEIYVGPFPHDPMESNTPISIILFYPEKGFLVEYYFTNTVNGDFFQGCIDQMYKINIITWNPTEDKTINDLIYEMALYYWNYSHNGEFDFIFKSVDEIMTKDAFYNKYKTANMQTCIQVPKLLWPYE